MKLIIPNIVDIIQIKMKLKNYINGCLNLDVSNN